MDALDVRKITTDALSYWERRRLIYNLILGGVVLAYFGAGLPKTVYAITVDRSLGLFALAVLANVAYCAAYVPDIFAQLSGFGEQWRRSRWAVFAIGCGLASVITRGIVKGELT